MKFLLVILIVLPISVLGAKYFSTGRGTKMGIRNIILTGTEYILLGIVLGSSVLNIIDKSSIVQLKPFIVFGLSWIGFLFGIQFEFRLLKKLPKKYFSITAVQAVTTYISVFFSIYYIAPLFTVYTFEDRLVTALFLSTLAMSTAPLALSIVNRFYKFKNQKLFNLLRYISSVDSLFALFFFAFLISFMKSSQFPQINIIEVVGKFSLSVIIGFIPALIFSYLLRIVKNYYEFTAIFIGLIAFIGGFSTEFGHSSLFSGFFGGILLANVIRKRVDALLFLREAEHSVYILVLLLIGASLKITGGVEISLLIVFFIFRVVGKVSGNFVAIKIFPANFKIPPYYGISLLSEGGTGFAILINFYILFPGFAQSVFIIVLLSSLVTEFLSPRIISAMFKKKELTKEKIILKKQ